MPTHEATQTLPTPRAAHPPNNQPPPPPPLTPRPPSSRSTTTDQAGATHKPTPHTHHTPHPQKQQNLRNRPHQTRLQPLLQRVAPTLQDCKWLDVRALAETLFPNDEIGRVLYFSARVIARTGRSPRGRGSRCTSARWQPGMSRSSSASSVAARAGCAAPSRALAALTVPVSEEEHPRDVHRGEGLRCQPRLAPTDRCLPRRLRDGDRAHQRTPISSSRSAWRALTSDSTSRCSAPATVPHGAFAAPSMSSRSSVTARCEPASSPTCFATAVARFTAPGCGDQIKTLRPDRSRASHPDAEAAGGIVPQVYNNQEVYRAGVFGSHPRRYLVFPVVVGRGASMPRVRGAGCGVWTIRLSRGRRDGSPCSLGAVRSRSCRPPWAPRSRSRRTRPTSRRAHRRGHGAGTQGPRLASAMSVSCSQRLCYRSQVAYTTDRMIIGLPLAELDWRDFAR